MLSERQKLWQREYITRPHVKQRLIDWRAKERWRVNLSSTRTHARKAGIKHTLSAAWAKKKYTGFCELTGLAFRISPRGSGPSPYSPSIDRIDPTAGYVPENCRFILFGINSLKGRGTDDDVILIAKHLLKSRGLDAA